MKLALLGSNGAIGQPLALLLATSNRLKELSMYDIMDPVGVATDLSHVDVDCKILPSKSTAEAVEGADIVAVAAGFARKPGMTRDDLFNTNSKIIYEISQTIAKTNPKAMVAIITNPINSTVPIVCETFLKNNETDLSRIFGVTSLDIMRANKFIGDALDHDPSSLFCPVVGGHQGESIVPLLSQASTSEGKDVLFGPLSSAEGRAKMVAKIQNAGTEVVNAKKNGSASLSMAYSAYMYLTNLMMAKSGSDVKEYGFVNLKNFGSPYGSYFSVPMIINEQGVSKILPIDNLLEEEETALVKATEEVARSVKRAKEFLDSLK